MARAQDLGDELVVGVDDLVANLDLWRTYAAGAHARSAVAHAAHAANAATAKAGAARAALSGFNEVLAVVGLLGAITLGPHVGVTLHDGVVFGFAVIFFMMYRPLRDFGDARGWLLRGSVAFSAIDALSEAPRLEGSNRLREGEVDAAERSAPATGNRVEPEVLELRGFGARRMTTTTTLLVEPGEIVALVGPTGSGKTSLLRAMLGLEPATGRLRYGGRELSTAGIGPPERPFAWVPQEAPLVGDTLLGNVGLFSDTERARQALEWVGASRLQRELAETKLGPGGRSLSGGERRLVSLARALATGLPVLLLDEPTEGLDSAAAERVVAALARLGGHRTLLVVTHRTDVAAIADRVVDVGARPQRARQPFVA
ncbi:MAG TPA: ATP-binding cassette domain-containing protein [Polyangiaceae bacterium]|nr:ATP-binding cassette domain-containing protein [Polyangiaceae bacterium]